MTRARWCENAVSVWSVAWLSLRQEEAVWLDVGVEVVLLHGGHPGSAIVLGTAPTLLITEVLASIRSK